MGNKAAFGSVPGMTMAHDNGAGGRGIESLGGGPRGGWSNDLSNGWGGGALRAQWGEHGNAWRRGHARGRNNSNPTSSV